MKFSFIIPCYNSSKTISNVISEIKSTVHGKDDFEIICINDCSPDNVYEVLKTISSKDKSIKLIDLSKNFGQHNAIMAGFSLATGDIIVALDDDGQSPVNEVYKLIEKIENGADVVFSTTKIKQHGKLKLIGSKINEFMSGYLLGTPSNLNIVPLYAFRNFIAKEITRYTGSYSYILGLLYRSSKNIEFVEVIHRKREIGGSNYSFKKSLALWINGFTAFSVKPLRMATILGFVTAALGFIYGGYTIINKLINPQVLIGYSSLMAALLFIGGVIMLILGLIGEYIGRIYISLNNAPQYVIREKVNFEV